MRFLSADYLYPLHLPPIKEGVLQITNDGEVIKIIENRKRISESKIEIFEGILCPGFVNAHCHLELSHLVGVAEKGKGFLDFVQAIRQRSNFSEIQILSAIDAAERQMKINGIVAVGDICNTTDTLIQKQKGNLKYYNFIEIFGVNESNASAIINAAKELRDIFRNRGMIATITPHAPYSVPPKLMNEIAQCFDKKDQSFSIHIQEIMEENTLFLHKKGTLFDWLINMNASEEIWKNRDRSTAIIRELENKKILLVHNTFAQQQDMTANYYCTCPKANLYIEKSLPDYTIFNTEKLCVGTDSLASNDTLSILDELKIIKANSDFNWNTLLKIACKNGAEALSFSDLGTFEIGKKPGVNLIIDFDRVVPIL